MYDHVVHNFQDKDFDPYDQPDWLEEFLPFVKYVYETNQEEYVFYTSRLFQEWQWFIQYLIEHSSEISSTEMRILLSYPSVYYRVSHYLHPKSSQFYPMVVDLLRRCPNIFQDTKRHNIYGILLLNVVLNGLVLKHNLSSDHIEAIYRHLAPLQRRIMSCNCTIWKVLTGEEARTEEFVLRIKELPPGKVGRFIAALELTDNMKSAFLLADKNNLSQKNIRQAAKIADCMDGKRYSQPASLLCAGQARRFQVDSNGVERTIKFIRHPLAAKYPLVAALIIVCPPDEDFRDFVRNALKLMFARTPWAVMKVSNYSFSYRDLKDAVLHLNLRKIMHIRQVMAILWTPITPVTNRKEFLEYVEQLPDSDRPLQEREIYAIPWGKLR